MRFTVWRADPNGRGRAVITNETGSQFEMRIPVSAVRNTSAPRAEAFLREYIALARKHGLQLDTEDGLCIHRIDSQVELLEDETIGVEVMFGVEQDG